MTELIFIEMTLKDGASCSCWLRVDSIVSVRQMVGASGVRIGLLNGDQFEVVATCTDVLKKIDQALRQANGYWHSEVESGVAGES